MDQKGHIIDQNIYLLYNEMNYELYHPALQCRLNCDPGYESELPPIITCVDGNYEPNRPEEFVCQKTVALIVTKAGEMEVFSDNSRCNRVMGNIPPMTLGGHTVNLLDNYLVITESREVNNGWWYSSLSNARQGLLANSWTESPKTLGNDAPVGHLSFVYGKDLFFLGGEKNTQGVLQNGREENGEWNAVKLTKEEDGAIFDQQIQESCIVRGKKGTFFVLGGKVNGQITSNIYKINMKEQNVKEVGSLTKPRAQHACAVVPGSASNELSIAVLVTGGTSDQDGYGYGYGMGMDELFELDNSKGRSRLLHQPMNVPRMNHRMVTLGDSIFALGGQRNADDDSTLETIEKFNPDSESWTVHSTKLLSKSTNGLAVTELPLSAVSCNQGCKCGRVRSTAKIVGGEDAEVRLPF